MRTTLPKRRTLYSPVFQVLIIKKGGGAEIEFTAYFLSWKEEGQRGCLGPELASDGRYCHFSSISALGRKAREKPTRVLPVNERNAFPNQLFMTISLIRLFRAIPGPELSRSLQKVGWLSGLCLTESLRTKAGCGGVLGWRAPARSSKGDKNGSWFEKPVDRLDLVAHAFNPREAETGGSL